MKLVSLISGGIDSPVASYIMARRGADVILLHMDNGEFSDGRDLEKVRLIAKRLEEVTGREFPVYMADHGSSQREIMDKCQHSYQCVMCKRTMQRVAKRFAQANGCSGIIMGDSLGQVASQTLRNIRAEGRELDFPIVRPLIGMDKTEIIDIAREIGTYDLSIMPSGGCSAVPSKPITEARVEDVMAQQARVDFDSMVERSLASIRRVQ